MSNPKRKEELDKLIQSVGSIAEMGVVFFRAAVQAGATMEEATRLTQAYFGAMIFGRGQAPQPQEED